MNGGNIHGPHITYTSISAIYKKYSHHSEKTTMDYMEVVCLILGPMLASQPCLHAFWVLTSLHLLSFLLKMFFIILVYITYATEF